MLTLLDELAIIITYSPQTCFYILHDLNLNHLSYSPCHHETNSSLKRKEDREAGWKGRIIRLD